MSLIEQLISFIIHIDKHLLEIVNIFGFWSYAVLFLIIFVETGVVILPFLPGDSLLFAASAFAATGALDIALLILVFLIAAILGDTINYQIGKSLGKSVSNSSFFGKLINQEKMQKAESFFNQHGGKTIVIARFIPFIRTFIPFVAGASRMNYRYFLMYNIVGALLWVGLCTAAGYFFGNIPIVRNNFSTVFLLIIFLSVLPAIISFIKVRVKKTS